MIYSLRLKADPPPPSAPSPGQNVTGLSSLSEHEATTLLFPGCVQSLLQAELGQAGTVFAAGPTLCMQGSGCCHRAELFGRTEDSSGRSGLTV